MCWVRKVAVRAMLAMAATVVATMAAPAHAQSVKTEQADNRIIEEVIVRAQKRDQGLQDVPISIAVVDGDAIKQNAFVELEDLSASMPAFTVTEAAISTLVFVRGLGSGINQGFEQSVGMYVDGVYAGRNRQYRIPFLDIQRVELLRGPQGILFGKNTIAGAVNISTGQPTDEFEAYVSGRYAPTDEEQNATAVISGPLTDTLAGRVAVGVSSFDGYIRNSVTGDDEVDSDETSFRGSLAWHPSDLLSITGKYEYSDFDVDGRTTQITNDGGLTMLYQFFDPLFEDRFNEHKSTGGLGPDKSDTDAQNATLTIDYQLGDYTLTSISAYSDYSYFDKLDIDFGPIPMLFQREPQDFDQWSQEIRFTSPLSDTYDFIVGAYIEGNNLDNRNSVDANLLPLGLILPPATRIVDFDQDTDSWAVFGQGNWHLRDDLRLNFGLRYTEDDKDAKQSLRWVDFRTNNPNPMLGNSYALLGFGVAHSFDESRSEDNLSPSLGIQYDATDDVMLYASGAQGYKAGGFNAAETTSDLANFEFGDETSTTFEIGAKTRLANGAARLDVAVFHTKFDDLQVSTFEGVQFVVGNAAESTSKGVEIDGAFRVTDALTLSGSWTYLDSEYDSFRDAACTIQQTVDSGLGPFCTQNLSGEVTQYAPKNSGRVNVSYDIPIGDGHLVTAEASVFHSDGFYFEQDLDREAYQSSYSKFDARLGWVSPGGEWTAAIIAKNITDRKTKSHGSDVPLLDGAHYATLDRPSSVAIQVSRFFQ